MTFEGSQIKYLLQGQKHGSIEKDCEAGPEGEPTTPMSRLACVAQGVTFWNTHYSTLVLKTSIRLCIYKTNICSLDCACNNNKVPGHLR